MALVSPCDVTKKLNESTNGHVTSWEIYFTINSSYKYFNTNDHKYIYAQYSQCLTKLLAIMASAAFDITESLMVILLIHHTLIQGK